MKWNTRNLVETIGVLAVVFSLLLVAYEIRQANRIAVVNTEFELRRSYKETNLALLNNPDMVDLVIKLTTPGVPLEGQDRIRAVVWTYIKLNTWVAMSLAYENGVTTEQTYRNVLDNIESSISDSSPEMREIYRESVARFPSLAETAVFQHIVDVLDRYD